MEPLTATSLKLALPALREGFTAVRRELARRPQDGSLPVRLGEVDGILEEAIGVLARQSDGVRGAIAVGVKGLLSRPAEFSHEAPRQWIATEIAQESLKDAARAAIRGQDDTVHGDRAIAHYRTFLDDEAEQQPDPEQVYLAALDFLLRSLNRELDPGQSILFAQIEGVSDQLARALPGDTSDLVDERVHALVDRLRRTRFFRSADTQRGAAQLAESVTAGRFRGGSPGMKAHALAWCARTAAFTAPATAQQWLHQAERLSLEPSEALTLARAFVAAQSDWRSGLARLSADRSLAEATAAFQIMRQGLGSAAAVDQAKTAGLSASALDSDGRYALLATLVETRDWSEALEVTRTLESADFSNCPALMWLAASVLVASCLPEDMRPMVLHEVPNNPQTCPLREDQAALEARRTAGVLMAGLASTCDDLELPREAAAARRYALWLRLAEGDDDKAVAVLRERFANPATAIAYLPLAIGYGLHVDRDKAARAVERQVALEGEASSETLNALAALLVDQAVNAPADAAALLDQFRAEFDAYMEPQSLLALETRILVEAGRPEDARARLETATVELTGGARELLESLIEGGGPPPLATLEALYRDDPKLPILVQLVHRLRGGGATPRYLELARRLLEQMPTSEFAEDIVGFLVDQGRDEEAAEMLALAGDLIERSDVLVAHAAWLRYRSGDLPRAEAMLARLEAGRDAPQDRELRLQLLVAGGKWEALDGYLERQWECRAERSAREMARCANLAAQIGAKRALEFARAAVAAAPEDPEVLLAGYMAATTAGREEELPEASQWLMAAAARSGVDGPVQTAPLETLLEGKEAWEERTAIAGNALVEGSAPLASIAAVAARPWLELLLAPLIRNLEEHDPRRVQLMALFSGRKRIDEDETLATHEIAIDASALITLAAVDALDALDPFERVFVPHSLLADMFEQRGRMSFHQPSRISFSKRLLDMASDGKLQTFTSTAVPDIALVTQIGLSPATVLAEAAAHGDGQHIYVHPFPIRQVGSLLADPVPLADFAAHLASCLGVVDLLERAGKVTGSEAEQARRYLAQHDAPWPEEPPIRPGAVLYLSELAIDYFRYVGLLDRISAAGVTAVVAAGKLEEARTLRDTAQLFEKAERVIDRLREYVARHVSEGRVVLAPVAAGDEIGDAETRSLVTLVGRAPVLVSDERFINRHARFELDSGEHRIIASVDLLRLLANGGQLAEERVDAIEIDLRRRGVAFVPLSAGAVESEIARTQLSIPTDETDTSPAIQETGELRALRENIRQIQAHGWFDRTHDTPWLLDVQSILTRAIHAQWRAGLPPELARARSRWLYRLIDTRAWSESQVGGGMSDIGALGVVLDQARVASVVPGLPDEAKGAFEAWVVEEVLDPVWAREHRQRGLLLDHLRGLVRAIARETHGDLGISERLAAAHAFRNLPEFLQIAVLEDERFQDDVGYTIETRMELADASFLREPLLQAVRKLYLSPDEAVSITDEQDRRWELRTDAGDPHWPLLFKHGAKGMRLRGLLGIHPDSAKRVAMLDALLSEHAIAPAIMEDWRETLAERPLEPDEIEALETMLGAAPPRIAEALQSSFEKGGAPISLLVPPARRYWEHLAGNGGAATLAGHLETWRPASWSAAVGVEKACWSLLAASHGNVLADTPFFLTPAEWRELGAWALADGDVLAMTGFVEVALPHVHADAALEEQVLAVAAKLEGLDAEDEGGPLFLFSSLAIFVEGELGRAGTLADWPPWHRRMAAMAHAALLSRGTLGQIDTARFARFCLEQRGWRFALQTLVDMRLEPRWRTEYMVAAQLRHEFLGRIFNAATALAPDRLTPGLKAHFLAETGSLRDRLQVPQALLPGPLEGAVSDDLLPLEGEMLTDLEDSLCEEPVALGLIRRLSNLEGLAKLPRALCERADARIREHGARLLSALPQSEVYGHLLGLANLAASHRLSGLAETVRLLTRLQRLRGPIDLTEELQLVLHAAAAHEEIEPWRTFVGDWTREMANRSKDKEEARTLLTWLDGLCEVEPQLYGRTARARALLRLTLDA